MQCADPPEKDILMKIELEEDHGVTVARLVGRLDGFGAKEAESTLSAPRQGLSLVFDCAELSYLSSAGVRFFLLAQKSAAVSGGTLALSALRPFCASVLEMSGLAGIIPVFASAREAAVALSGGGPGGPVAEQTEVTAGSFTFHQVGNTPGTIDILGEVGNVLDCQITEETIVGNLFSKLSTLLGLVLWVDLRRIIYP